MQYYFRLGGGMIYSVNIIIQVDFTAYSGILGLGGHDIQCKHYHTGRLYSLFRHATNYDCYTYVYSWVWAYSRALAGGQAQYVDFGHNTICTKIRLFKVIHYFTMICLNNRKKANLFVKL